MIIEQKEIKYQGKVVFEKLVMSPNFKRAPKFFYEDEACFLFLTKGAFQFRTPVKLLQFSEGDGMLAKCGNYLMENMSMNSQIQEQTVTVIGAFFYPELVKTFFSNDLSLHTFQRPITVTKVSIEPIIKSFFDGLDYLLSNPEIADENLIINKQKELLILLSKTEESVSIQSFVNSLFADFEYDFREVVSKNLFANLTIKEFAFLAGMSEASFKRKFKAVFHDSPASYLLKKRLMHAQQLLLLKNQSVADTAYACGFNSPSAFNKTFKKHFNESPSAFRISQKDKSLS